MQFAETHDENSKYSVHNRTNLECRFDHLRRKRVQVASVPRHKKLNWLWLRVFYRPQHDITKIEQPHTLGNNAHSHAGVNKRHNGMNVSQLLDIVRRDSGRGEEVSRDEINQT